MNLQEFQQNLETASPLEVPSLLMQLEQYDCETAQELMARINKDFQKEDLVNNVLTPVMTTIVDSLLMLPVFKGFTRKLGLNANRVMTECVNFNYDGKCIYLQPDSFIEYSNQQRLNREWAEENRPIYDRSTMENISEMNRYKQKKAKEAGSRKNMRDEYTDEHNVTAKKNNPDFRRNDPKNEYNAETDHIIPLKRIFEQVQSNMGLSEGDIKRIVNSEDNLAVTSRRINNPKRDMTNSEFIAQQETLKAQGKPYVELTQEQKDNMIRMEREAQTALENEINTTLIDNLLGKGIADREIRKAAFEQKAKELGRKLTEQERQDLDRRLSREKATDIHKQNLVSSGKQTLMYALGSTVLFIIKPVYYEMKDSFLHGFKEGVGASSFKEAFSLRFNRVKDYVWSQILDIKHLMGSAMDMLKNLLSAIIEGIIGMFVGIFKSAFRVIKEGIKILMQSFDVLFGPNSQNYTAAEKGDAILKIFGASAAALCGIWIDLMLDKFPVIPENFRGIISTLLSGLASILVFYLLDKADLFNTKKERRNSRIKEIFDERVRDIREATKEMNECVIAKLRQQALENRKILTSFSEAFSRNDYVEANGLALQYASFLKIDVGYATVEEIKTKIENNTLNWDM